MIKLRSLLGKASQASVPHSLMANLGCGAQFHQDWDNFDYRPANPNIRHVDLNQGLPLAVQAYEVVYMSHVLEHLSRSRVPLLLGEIFSSLKPGGVLRLVVPDLEAIARSYLSELEAASTGDKAALDRHEWMTVELLDQMVRQSSGGFMGRMMAMAPTSLHGFIKSRVGKEADSWLGSQVKEGIGKNWSERVYMTGVSSPKSEMEFRRSGEIHRWMYDRVSLKQLLSEAGFAEVKVCRSTESAIPNFSSYRLDSDENGATRKPDSLFIEGIRKLGN